MTKPPILLVGAGGHARACIDVIEQEGRFSVAGLLGTSGEVGTRLHGYMVLGVDADLPALLKEYRHTVVSVGQVKTPEPRIRLFELLEKHGATLPIIVSPRAYVSPRAQLGAGTIVMHGAVVNAGAVVGCNCIINSLALVEHDVVIADHCHIGTAATINGAVRIGTGTFVGSNTSVRELINIGERCVIGMGQRVVADCNAGSHLPHARERA
jgi:sugar O-acyltransferase (sialic acid O-acetyltransferase NeuD family)